jgi:acyl-CoA synthetase (AMP-forming)/AMP-acid ligase II
MKRLITLVCTALLLGASLSGCIVVPVHPYYHYYRAY